MVSTSRWRDLHWRPLLWKPNKSLGRRRESFLGTIFTVDTLDHLKMVIPSGRCVASGMPLCRIRINCLRLLHFHAFPQLHKRVIVIGIHVNSQAIHSCQYSFHSWTGSGSQEHVVMHVMCMPKQQCQPWSPKARVSSRGRQSTCSNMGIQCNAPRFNLTANRAAKADDQLLDVDKYRYTVQCVLPDAVCTVCWCVWGMYFVFLHNHVCHLICSSIHQLSYDS